MSYNNEEQQIIGRCKAVTDILVPVLPVAWPNVSFTVPDPPAMHMEFYIQNGEAFQNTILASTNNHRHIGVIYMKLKAPVNHGSGDALVLADTLAAIFRSWCGTTVRCRTATVKSIGEVDGWYQINITIPFHRDELL